MNDSQLTLPSVLNRAANHYAAREVVVRESGRPRTALSYVELHDRARRLGAAMQRLRVDKGVRVATLCWNTQAHLEAYFGVTAIGGVVHTMNPRLHVDQLAYTAQKADDRVIIVDEELVPVLAELMERDVPIEHVIVASAQDRSAGYDGALNYEDVIRDHEPAPTPVELTEQDPAILCFTSGTTGRPKGVLYPHRALVLKSLIEAHGDLFNIGRRDSVLIAVPLFHIAAWCLPFAATLFGATQVLPGSSFDPDSILAAIEEEAVTFTAAVPTLWLGVKERVETGGDAADLDSLRTIVSGGSSVPPFLIDWYLRHGVDLRHAWGMTESVALGTIQPPNSGAQATGQGEPIPCLELRARGESGLIDWDGEQVGELEIRGPFVARSYLDDEDPERFTADGFLRTGDVVAIDPNGSIEIRDRAKDLIKSGGEWISSVALEHALMEHPAVYEAAVLAAPHPRWGERPLAIVVSTEGGPPSEDALLELIAPRFASWWLPDEFRFVDEIPHTGTGKVDKVTLREQQNVAAAG